MRIAIGSSSAAASRDTPRLQRQHRLPIVVFALAFGVAPPAHAQATPPAPASPSVPAPKPDPAAAPQTASVGGTPATIIDEQQIESLLGKKVESQSGEDMGQIVDVLADKAGQARAAVIDFGGFFGVGSRKIAVDWRSLRFPAEAKADKVIVELPRSQLRVAPVYKEGEPVVVLGPAAAATEPVPAPTPATSVVPAAPTAPAPTTPPATP